MSPAARSFSQRASRFVAAVSVAAVVGGCASSPISAEWVDPALRGQVPSLRGARVLVACEAPDVAVRNVCQDRLADQVRAKGASPSFVAPDLVLTRDRSLDQQLVPVAQRDGDRAVLVVSLTPIASENERPSLSFGIGGFGFGGGSVGGGGVGVTTPVGEGRVVTGYGANARISDAAAGRLIWTASASAPPSKDLDAQLRDLSVGLIDSATKAGLF